MSRLMVTAYASSPRRCSAARRSTSNSPRKSPLGMRYYLQKRRNMQAVRDGTADIEVSGFDSHRADGSSPHVTRSGHVEGVRKPGALLFGESRHHRLEIR